jgi:hypothetical protein
LLPDLNPSLEVSNNQYEDSDSDQSLELSDASAMSRSTRSRASQVSVVNTNSSGSTVDYEVPQLNDDENDCIMIVPEVETIDLCTQAPIVLPVNMQNQIIDITDSPANGTRSSNRRSSSVAIVETNSAPGPSRSRQNRRSNNRTSPYASAVPPPPTLTEIAGPSKSSTPKSKKTRAVLDFDESFSQAPDLKVSCPVCMESVRGREPVSTICGHIFCKGCIEAAFRNAGRKCPMCRKNLPARNSFIKLHF